MGANRSAETQCPQHSRQEKHLGDAAEATAMPNYNVPCMENFEDILLNGVFGVKESAVCLDDARAAAHGATGFRIFERESS